MDAVTLLYALSALLILVGLAGTVLPALPGLPIVFAGMLLAAWAGDFERISGWTMAVLGALTLLALGLDFVAGLLGAKRVGASKLALLGAAIGTLVGLFFGLFGLILGPFVGAVLGELAHGRQAAKSMKVGLGTWLGMAFGAIAKIALAFVMLGIFLFALAF
jgi:uncharacterized protein YqgC (DUF456 family)